MVTAPQKGTGTRRVASRPSQPGSRQLAALPPETPERETLPRLLFHPEPDYPPSARKRRFEGTVTLIIEMLANGTIGDIKIITSSGHDSLDRAAINAVKQWRHAPATRNDIPVTQWAEQTLRFTLTRQPQR